MSNIRDVLFLLLLKQKCIYVIIINEKIKIKFIQSALKKLSLFILLLCENPKSSFYLALNTS